jgi:hypothetical protein
MTNYYELMAKAKRRINRFVRDGKATRVRETANPVVFEYVVKHNPPEILRFRRDSLGRLYKIHN